VYWPSSPGRQVNEYGAVGAVAVQVAFEAGRMHGHLLDPTHALGEHGGAGQGEY
jgi:hypothetical protein